MIKKDKKEKKSTFRKIEQIVIWTMLICTVGSILLSVFVRFF